MGRDQLAFRTRQHVHSVTRRLARLMPRSFAWPQRCARLDLSLVSCSASLLAIAGELGPGVASVASPTDAQQSGGVRRPPTEAKKEDTFKFPLQLRQDSCSRAEVFEVSMTSKGVARCSDVAQKQKRKSVGRRVFSFPFLPLLFLVRPSCAINYVIRLSLSGLFQTFNSCMIFPKLDLS